MVKRGKSVYLPKGFIEELEDIKRKENLITNREAFNRLAQYSRKGRDDGTFLDELSGNLGKRIKRNPFKNKRGSVQDILLIGILMFALGLGIFLFYFVQHSIITPLVNNPIISSSVATNESLTYMETNVGSKFDYLVFGTFIALLLGLLLTSWFIGGHPIFIFIYFLVIGVGVFIMVVLSDTWEAITTSNYFVDTLKHFPLTNHLLTNLPIYLAIIGALALVILFAKPYMAGDNIGEMF